MVYIGIIFFAFGVWCLASTLFILKKYKNTYGDSLGEFLDDNR